MITFNEMLWREKGHACELALVGWAVKPNVFLDVGLHSPTYAATRLQSSLPFIP